MFMQGRTKREKLNSSIFSQHVPMGLLISLGFASWAVERSDKVKFSLNDGAIHTDEETGNVSGSSVNVNGTIKATSFSSTDVVAINFGSDMQPLDYALEFVCEQEFQEWD